MKLGKRTVIWEEIAEPPKNYIWIRNNKPYEYNKNSSQWELTSWFKEDRKSKLQDYRTNGHECVDLGLDSKTLWAIMNVGALNPYGFGNHFAWGEIEPKGNYYNWHKYKYGSKEELTKYNKIDNITRLELIDDAAAANWGGKWVIPSREDWEELENSCSWVWNTEENKKGWVLTGPNKNTLFLPAAGKYRSSLTNLNTNGGYWSSDLNTNIGNWTEAYGITFNGNSHEKSSFIRAEGYSVRPVIKIATI